MTNSGLTLPTRLGHAGWDDHEVRGTVVFDLDSATTRYVDLALLVLDIPPSDAMRTVCTLCAQASLNPDPRIPPMKLIRLGAAYGSFLSGLATGFAGLTGAAVGISAVLGTTQTLTTLRATLGDEASDPQLDAALGALPSRLPGFGAPGRPTDERYVWIAERLEATMVGPRPWWTLLHRVGDRLAFLHGKPGLRQPNLGGSIAAALLDAGCPPASVEAAAGLVTLLPLLGNAHEGAEQAPALLRSLPIGPSVDYVGAPARRSPRALAAAQDRDGE